MTKKDYYKILDIPEFSSQQEIKSAYRKLARKFHPDVAGNSDDVVARFKEINEAYSILSDACKKDSYDRARRFYNYAKEDSSEKTSYNKYTSNPNQNEKYEYKNEYKRTSFWNDFFKAYQKYEEVKVPKKGCDVYSDIQISEFEAATGTTKVVNMLQTQFCDKCYGRKFVNGEKCPHCGGDGKTSNYKKFTVKIPAGIHNNSKIRLAGEGEKGVNGASNGDLYLTVHIIDAKNYKIEGLNILKTVPITPYEAVLGTEIAIPTLIGNITFKVAPNTKNGQKIRLSGCGITQNKKVGDMIVTVEIQIPKKLTNEEIELYKKLQEISSFNGNVRDRLEY